MSNFRVLILVLLVLALAILGMLYVNISGKMDLIQMQQQMAAMNANTAAPAAPATGLQAAPHSAEQQTTVVADPVMAENLAHQKAMNERLKRENEELRKENSVKEEELALMERRALEKNDPKLQMMNEISNSELIGRVTEYYHESNLVIFEVLGQPNLKLEQEVCIRRGSGILVSLKIDGIQANVCEAYMLRNLMLENNPSASIKIGDEVILLPASLHESSIPVETAVPVSDVNGSASGANKPAANGNNSAPEPYVVPWQ